jgi:hypothetical protein
LQGGFEVTKKEETVLEETVNVLKKENNEIKEILKVLSEKLIKKEEQEKLPFSLERNIQMNISAKIKFYTNIRVYFVL